ncbi:MAG: hypothetical protein OWU84_11930 [Firmicutes bacterium]|nr:hypothetical protein [Bacillota bacterium]
MAPNALSVIAAWILTGMALGLLSTVYGAARAVYRFWPGVGEFFDWLWFVVAAALYLVVTFWTEWGVFRIWSLFFMLGGFLLWSGLGAPWAFPLASALFQKQARLVHYALWPGVRAARFVGRQLQRRRPPKEPPNS